TGMATVNAGGALVNVNSIGSGVLPVGDWPLIVSSALTLNGSLTLSVNGVTGSVFQAGLGRTYSLVTSATTLSLHVASSPAPATAYWLGSLDNNLNTITPNSATNWRTTAAGTTDTFQLPGA